MSGYLVNVGMSILHAAVAVSQTIDPGPIVRNSFDQRTTTPTHIFHVCKQKFTDGPATVQHTAYKGIPIKQFERKQQQMALINVNTIGATPPPYHHFNCQMTPHNHLQLKHFVMSIGGTGHDL